MYTQTYSHSDAVLEITRSGTDEHDESKKRPCGDVYPHATAHCTEDTDHKPPHRAYGDKYPGARREKSMCTWKDES